MARYVSFALLLAVIVLLSIVFYKVMAGFLIPLFLAALLVVIFSPVFEWQVIRFKANRYLEKKRRAQQLAALLTTILVSLAVLVPFAILIMLAAVEARNMLTTTSTTTVIQKIKQVRTNLNLDLPAAEEIRSVERIFELLFANMKPEELEYHQQLLFEIKGAAISLGKKYDLVYSEEMPAPHPEDPDEDPLAALSSWEAFCQELNHARELNDSLATTVAARSGQPPRGLEFDDSLPTRMESINPELFHEYQVDLMRMQEQFKLLKAEVLLGTNGWLKELLNPSDSKLVDYGNRTFAFASDQLVKVGSASTSFLGRLLIGTAIMLFAFYFFLLDGPGMLESIKGLSPLDDEHEQELVTEFSRVSRAVVLATLLSAIAQGILAGFGFYFVGLESIFLLTMLTTCLALVPFVGAAAVWFPCSLYLYFIDGNVVGAVGLAIYGALVISMADNFIKPIVLHGQSNLHPLLAFLSIIGGVSVLGPIGILIGPMVVAFLQTLLEIFQREVSSMDAAESTPTQVPTSGS